MIYGVTFTNQAGAIERSGYFDTVGAAKKFAKWLRTRKFVVATQVWQGGSGGIRVEG